MMLKKKIRYATKSAFKREEVQQLLARTLPANGRHDAILLSEAFEFDFFDVSLAEPLERDLQTMVQHKVLSAYRQVMAPCVVEHAALILEKFRKNSYPGGLTQPMWDAVGAHGFIESTRWAGERAIAQCLIAYCNGRRVITFVGETEGTIANSPRGGREFYWDTVFCPAGGGGKSYSEIAAGPDGIQSKMDVSQSSKAFMQLFEYLLTDKDTLFED